MIGGQPGVTVHYESDPARLLATAHAFGPSVVLLDLRMPGIDGLGVIRMLRADPVTAGIPILMLSSEDDPHVKAAGFAAGAADYLVKWPDRIELMARVRAHARSHRLAGELVRRSEELARAQAALHEAQHAEAIGKLTVGVAHDINNILHLINGHLELMRVEHDGDARSLRRIGAASEGVRRGTRLAAELLATARARREPAATLDVAGFLHEFAARDGGAMSLRLAAGAHAAALDPADLGRILDELVANARRAMDDTAPVIVELDGEECVDRDAALPPGQYVRISVVDTGAGMAPEVARRAFEPFFSTRHGVPGAGLGLPVAAGLARKHAGHIDIDSAPGRGTRVTLRFPRRNA
jgi:signal transduction histidine kinase